MSSSVNARFLIISDTHGEQLDQAISQRVEVAIHCGDLTEESKLIEFRSTLSLIKNINAELKLVIAGNHDFTLDDDRFASKVQDLKRVSDVENELIQREYGKIGEARSMINDAMADGIVFLDEGMHYFQLSNGASLKVYASPYTPSTNDWAFQYSHNDHDFNIDNDTDVVITHGPPEGILDRSDSGKRVGCHNLFRSIALARPRLHCFGHIHRSWGAKEVVWRNQPRNEPSHFTDIDNDKSKVIESLRSVTPNVKIDDKFMVEEKKEKLRRYRAQGYYEATLMQEAGIEKTMFVNAAIKTSDEEPQHLPWLIELDLPVAPLEVPISNEQMPISKKRALQDTESSTEKRQRKCSGS